MADKRLDRFFTQTHTNGLETSIGRFYSIYRGYVTSTLDNDAMGRVKLHVPLVSSQPELPAYALPVMPFGGRGYGVFFQPSVGESVYVLFEHGNVNKPLYIGGWWASPGGITELPPEIGNPINPSSTKVIKTPVGHGLVFEDSATYGKRVELFSGTNLTTKLHRLLFDDTVSNERILLQSSQGHFLTMSDAAQFVRLSSLEGFQLLLSDTLDSASLLTPSGHKLELSDASQAITVTTATGHSFALSDVLGGMAFSSVGGRTIQFNDSTQALTIQDPLGNSVIAGPTGISMVSASAVSIVAAAAASIVAAGAVSVIGNGTSMTSLGGQPAVQFGTGASTSLFLGAMTSTIIGAISIVLAGGGLVAVAGALVVQASVLLLGGAAARKLVDERIIPWLATHTHTAIGLGAPTSPPIQAPLILVPNAYTTSKVKAE